MPLLSFERANQWVPLDFMLKTDKMKLPLHEFSFVKATAPFQKPPAWNGAEITLNRHNPCGMIRNRKVTKAGVEGH